MSTTRKDGSLTWIVICAIIFCFFSFEYIYFYQSATIAFTQRVLSAGITKYNPVVGALLITLVAMIIQIITFRITRLGQRCHALTYFPSMLFLAAVTSCHRNAAGGIEWPLWLWLIPVYLVIYAGIVIIVRQWLPSRFVHMPLVSSPQLTLNLLVFVLMMIFVCK